MISTKKLVICVVNFLIILASILVLQEIKTFRQICIVGSIFISLNIFVNFIYSKKIITPVNIIALCFILFQFGIPILYAVDPEYTNWYISQFSSNNLIESSKYTIICLQFFCLGLIISNPKKKEKNKSSYTFSDQNHSSIYKTAKLLLLITGIVAFPLAIYVSYLASIHGYNYIKVDTMGIYNSITRIAQEMIVPALLLLILYAPNKKKENIYKLVTLIYAILLMFTGARTTSLALILVLLFISNSNDKKMTIKNKIGIILGIFLLLLVGAFIAQYRFSGTVENFTIISLIESVIEEMGFNFTSLPFTKLFVPISQNFRYGISYIGSIICLIPRSLDPIGIINSLYQNLPELWLADNLALRFGNLYNFGVGYSVIAESYFNFGNFGFISIFIQGLLVGKFLNNREETKFKKYIKYVMMFSLITYPRRSFITLLKSIEYCIVLIMIIILLYSKYDKKNHLEKNLKREEMEHNEL